jgi:DNA replication protein DnaC
MDRESKPQCAEGLKPRRLDWKKPPQGISPEQTLVFPCALKDKTGDSSRCPWCRGEGFILGVKGPYTAANVCSCVKKCAQCLGQGRRIEGGVSVSCRSPSVLQVVNLINAAQIPARYAEAALHRYQNFRERNGNGRKILAEVKEWLRDFQLGKSLVIEGPVGCGKTFILASLAKAFAIQGFSVKFADFFQLTSEIKAGFSEGKSDAALLQPLIDVDILVIDELGKGRNTDFELTVIDQLVCSRYNQRKSILASTNYKLRSPPPKMMSSYSEHPPSLGSSFNLDAFQGLEERIGQRIFSRLKEMSVFLELNEDDFRSRTQPSPS